MRWLETAFARTRPASRQLFLSKESYSYVNFCEVGGLSLCFSSMGYLYRQHGRGRAGETQAPGEVLVNRGLQFLVV